MISLKKQLYFLLNRDGILREIIKERVVREVCEGDEGRKWFFLLKFIHAYWCCDGSCVRCITKRS